MKRILVIKLTSLGDVIHTLPAITDVQRHYPGLEIDWMIDQSFQEIATFHPAVHTIFPTNHRKWLRNWGQRESYQAAYKLVRSVRQTEYDLVIDAQGNVKSAFLALCARGKKAGYDPKSAAEAVASFAYHYRYHMPKVEHAIPRLRRLFAAALDYPFPKDKAEYGIDRAKFIPPPIELSHYVTFVHSASWETKLWPEFHWQELIRQTLDAGYQIVLPWGSSDEERRAKRLQISDRVIVPPRLPLNQIGHLLQNSKAVVSVDTGLSHFATALNIPTISLYGPTNSSLIGALGPGKQLSSSLSCAPCNRKHCPLQTNPPACMLSITPTQAFSQLKRYLS